MDLECTCLRCFTVFSFEVLQLCSVLSDIPEPHFELDLILFQIRFEERFFFSEL